MSSWSVFATAEPALAQVAEARLRAEKHHVLATLRTNGSPRVSGTEVDFFDGDLVVGMMPGSRKATDLQRDPRFALHTNPGDGSMTGGDVKLAGVAVEETDPAQLTAAAGTDEPPEEFQLFRLDLHEVVITMLAPEGDHLDIDWWQPDLGITHVDRY